MTTELNHLSRQQLAAKLVAADAKAERLADERDNMALLALVGLGQLALATDLTPEEVIETFSEDLRAPWRDVLAYGRKVGWTEEAAEGRVN